MSCGIRDIKPPSQHCGGETVGCQRRAMGSAVDAVGPAGNDGDIVLDQSVRQIRGHLLAIVGRCPGSDEGGGPLCGLIEPRPAQCPQHHRWPSLRLRRGSAAERGERQCRPLVLVGCDQATTTTCDQFEILCRPVDFTPCFGTSRQNVVDLAPSHPLGRFDRPHPGHQGGKLGAGRFDDPRQVGPCPRRHIGHREAPGWRKLSATATSSRPGDVRPARSASVHATRIVRSAAAASPHCWAGTDDAAAFR